MMSVVDSYINYVKKEAIERPEKSFGKVVFGFKANKLKTRLLPKRDIAKGYQRLEAMMMSLVADALAKEGSYVWGNIFAPAEIMECFGLKTLSVECLSCYMTGYHLEDHFIDYAQDLGIAPTLCSYHKTFLGAVESGVLNTPFYGVTTSLSCDGNLNTFRYLDKKQGVPFTLLDIPYEDDEDSVNYLAHQIKELALQLEKHTGKPFREEKLRTILRTENETREALIEFFDLLKERLYPAELISHLYLMMGVHLLIGTEEFRDQVRFMVEDIKQYPIFQGKKILWVHLLPFYQDTLKAYFNSSGKYQLIPSDIVLDSMERMDEEHPFHSMARKIIHNVYNGSYQNKAKWLQRLAQELHPDAVIHFCHWGCKQASGGSVLLKEAMKEEGIPMLILDGDGIDKRNNHDGQIKTRLEAFLEMLEGEEE